MLIVQISKIHTLPMETQNGLQRIDLYYHSSKTAHLFLTVENQMQIIVDRKPVALSGGEGVLTVLLPVQPRSFDAIWKLCHADGNVIVAHTAVWKMPRHRTMYVMISSHTDIGLHNSQYIQRYNSSKFLDQAKKLCDDTEHRDENDRYRYTMEGTWFWNNYGADRSREMVEQIKQEYLLKDKIGYCCGIAGNHTQVFGMEELCRSAYQRKRLKEEWGLDSHTMAMIDINGMTMSMIQPLTEAGVQNIIFAPNHWNPLPSTIWKRDYSKAGVTLNPDAGGGGSRMDVRYASDLPLVFYWTDEAGHQLLVWCSTQYGYGGASFGLMPHMVYDYDTVSHMEQAMAEHLPLMEEKYPYDVWFFCCYDDDQPPEMGVTDSIAAWNQKWKWPKLRTLGNTDQPFNLLREKYHDRIPVLKGDMTGGWYQHPLTTPELLAQKFEVDRLLPTAEKWSVIASCLNPNYHYPAIDFGRAWDALLYNDEHSYGTSGYQGRKVYETWMQHRDWINKAQQIATRENQNALQVIAAKIPSKKDRLVLFNPTALERIEYLQTEEGKNGILDIPAFGYTVCDQDSLKLIQKSVTIEEVPPIVENQFYRIQFADNGSVASIYDKELNRELLDITNRFRANELVYTDDNHQSYYLPSKATFEVHTEAVRVSVIIRTEQPQLGTTMEQVITIPAYEKRIDIDNRMFHVRDMINKNRYRRYIYWAFPFAVEDCRRYCHLNGTVAEYAKDVTGHGTDVYMAVNEWCCAENNTFGVALLMLDSQLTEFDHIHRDKTDFGNVGEGSPVFVYAANDWLQMHTPGGSHLDYRFRYSITSYRDGYRNAKIPQMAERFANPIQTFKISKQNGVLDAERYSFIQVDEGYRLVGLKSAEDGNGIIARLYGDTALTNLRTVLTDRIERVCVDESPWNQDQPKGFGFSTYRLGKDMLTFTQRPVSTEHGKNGAPAPIGSVYTGLITEPCAAAGENAGHLYLLWGANTEPDFSHYALYRSEFSGFIPDHNSFIADVLPEEYVVGRYVDTGLKEHTTYYYRVCAVNKSGIRGEMSQEFFGITRESL